MLEGTPFGRYRLIELLGRGGMGEVWRAYDTETRRVVAVKVLPANLASDPVFEQRFRREAFTAAGLNDPHVVPIHTFGEIDGRLYVDMRLIEGRNLDEVLEDGPLEPTRAVMIIEQVASALNAAHRVGLVHRDVKPSNVLLGENDFAYLIDFGIAIGAGDKGLTGTGNVIGTWRYMAPERFTTGHGDTRADIYALTCVLYECLTNTRPFPGDSLEQQIAGHLSLPPPRPSTVKRGLSPELDKVIAVGMAKDPDQRYQTTVELARASRSAITAPVRQPPPAPMRQPPPAPIRQPSPRPIPKPRPPVQPREQPRAPTPAPPRERQQHPPVSGGVSPMAATRHRPPSDGRAHAPPRAHPAPSDQPPAAPASGQTPWWRSRPAMIAAAMLVVAAVSAIMLTVKDSDEAQTSPRGSAGRPNPGPLNGTYAAEFGEKSKPSGEPYDNAPGGSETWKFQSACGTDGCVATASKDDGEQSDSSTLVFDEVGGRWLAVAVTSGSCHDTKTDKWEIMSLELQGDGTLTGEYMYRYPTEGCVGNQQVTFTRSGDVGSTASMPDPVAQPALVTSPAQGLHGGYNLITTYTNGEKNEEAYSVATYCLRTGDRCLSYFWSDGGQLLFIFEKGKWVQTDTKFDGTCQSGGARHVETSQEFPLPQPTQDPIPQLTGTGRLTITGACPVNSDFNATAQRTGD